MSAIAELPPDAFALWAATADRIRDTTKRLEKLAALEAYLTTLDDEALAIASRLFSDSVFPRHDQRTTNVGGSILWTALLAVSGRTENELAEAYSRHGDGGDMVGDVLSGQLTRGHGLAWVSDRFVQLAAVKGTTARRAIVQETLGELGADEARYFAKLVGGELRIGLKEAQVEEALARTFGRPLAMVRHANLLRGDIGEVAALARHDKLAEARLALFHPLGFMLAQPLATPEEIVQAMPAPFAVEDKFDGIRVQAHVDGDEVRLFSRTLDDISRGYPEVMAALRGFGRGVVLDGELIAVEPSDPRRPRPFATLQKRLGRKAPSSAILTEVPVALVVYDILAQASVLVIEESYKERRNRLESLGWRGNVAFMAESWLLRSEEELEGAFARARSSGNEGLIVKDPRSPYTPGRRGKTWVKLKRALATLDVVVTGVERGNGRRNGVLSDYTFAVRASESDDTLLNVGKAYNGLTDAEIFDLTARFNEITIERHGRFHLVRPEVVLEVTFDIVQPSKRHKAGYALRFPRIVRVRDDKSPAEIDTLQRVRELAGEA